MEEVDHNEILNHCRIQQLLKKAAENLHIIFKNRWTIYRNLELPGDNDDQWYDDEKCGEMLVELCDTQKFFIPANFKQTLKNGKVGSWDITLTNMAILAVSKALKSHGKKLDNKEKKFIHQIRESFICLQ